MNNKKLKKKKICYWDTPFMKEVYKAVKYRLRPIRVEQRVKSRGKPSIFNLLKEKDENQHYRNIFVSKAEPPKLFDIEFLNNR